MSKKQSTKTAGRKGVTEDLTVGRVVSFLLPNGSVIVRRLRREKSPPSWRKCPFWPPDVFAVAAKLAELTGCYSELGIALSNTAFERARKRRDAKIAADLGQLWAQKGWPPPEAEAWWRELFNAWTAPIVSSGALARRWKRAAMRLLAVADEASVGMGFPTYDRSSLRGLTRLAFDEYVRALYGGAFALRYLPESLCMLVPSDRTCVQPKTMAPTVGCTLRSLSHHLALLPGVGSVSTRWHIGHRVAAAEDNEKKALNLLIVPFPYRVRGTDFFAAKLPEDSADGYFGLKQSWLEHPRGKLNGRALAEFIGDLVKVARAEAGEVHGVVLPESALSKVVADETAGHLARTYGNDVELFVAGAMDDSTNLPRNLAAIYRFGRPKTGRPRVLHRAYQQKHHRWKLDAGQIRRYHLGHVLSVQANYWENIAVDKRAVEVTLIRKRASVVSLICEDLARFDPVLPAINSIGPNLVIVLLMDGPLLRTRWPNRYATVLADDPGSSVLCVTSIGMVRRSHMPGATEARVVALWRDASGISEEISLPRDAQAMLVTLARETISQKTLDLRIEKEETIRFTLSGVRAISTRKVPTWAREAD